LEIETSRYERRMAVGIGTDFDVVALETVPSHQLTCAESVTYSGRGLGGSASACLDIDGITAVTKLLTGASAN
jgi:hypothetical protein